jgi:hypothetical protein
MSREQAKVSVGVVALSLLVGTPALARGPGPSVSKPRVAIATALAKNLDRGVMRGARKKMLLRTVGRMNMPERFSFATRLLGHPLSPLEREAIRSAHNVGSKRGATYATYSAAERFRKARILRGAFSRGDTRVLMSTGVAGFFRDLATGLNSLGGSSGLFENPYVRAERLRATYGSSTSSSPTAVERLNGLGGSAGLFENPSVLQERIHGSTVIGLPPL